MSMVDLFTGRAARTQSNLVPRDSKLELGLSSLPLKPDRHLALVHIVVELIFTSLKTLSTLLLQLNW